jgi:predicted nucleic acid-binding protein
VRLSRYTVILDACVLYPAPLRDLLIELASTDLFRAKWTTRIHDEWISALLHNRPELSEERLRNHTVARMNDAVLNSLVSGYEELEVSLELPDMNDRHVLAAAIHAKCDAIVTFNLRDFPREQLERYDIELLHPDDFLHFQYDLGKADVVTSVQRIRQRLRKPALTAHEYLHLLEAQGLPKTAAALRKFESVL